MTTHHEITIWTFQEVLDYADSKTVETTEYRDGGSITTIKYCVSQPAVDEPKIAFVAQVDPNRILNVKPGWTYAVVEATVTINDDGTAEVDFDGRKVRKNGTIEYGTHYLGRIEVSQFDPLRVLM